MVSRWLKSSYLGGRRHWMNLPCASVSVNLRLLALVVGEFAFDSKAFGPMGDLNSFNLALSLPIVVVIPLLYKLWRSSRTRLLCKKEKRERERGKQQWVMRSAVVRKLERSIFSLLIAVRSGSPWAYLWPIICMLPWRVANACPLIARHTCAIIYRDF